MIIFLFPAFTVKALEEVTPFKFQDPNPNPKSQKLKNPNQTRFTQQSSRSNPQKRSGIGFSTNIIRSGKGSLIYLQFLKTNKFKKKNNNNN